MLPLVGCALISVLCVLYGQYLFARNYPCLVMKFNKKWQNYCTYALSVPSGILSCMVLLLAIYKGIILNNNLA